MDFLFGLQNLLLHWIGLLHWELIGFIGCFLYVALFVVAALVAAEQDKKRPVGRCIRK